MSGMTRLTKTASARAASASSMAPEDCANIKRASPRNARPIPSGRPASASSINLSPSAGCKDRDRRAEKEFVLWGSRCQNAGLFQNTLR